MPHAVHFGFEVFEKGLDASPPPAPAVWHGIHHLAERRLDRIKKTASKVGSKVLIHYTAGGGRGVSPRESLAVLGTPLRQPPLSECMGCIVVHRVCEEV